MEFVNQVYRYAQDPACARRESVDFAVDSLLVLLAPMAPHITAELWERRHPGDPGVHAQPWLTADPELVRADSVTMVVQVNGKVRERLQVDASITEDEAIKRPFRRARWWRNWTAGRQGR